MKALHNFLSLAAMQAGAMLIGLLLMPYVTRIFGSEVLGLNSFGLAMATIFGMVGLCGLQIYGVREVARVRNSPVELQAAFSKLITYQFFFIGITILLYAVWVLYRPAEERIYLILFELFLLGTATDLVWLYNGLENFGYIALRTIVIRALGAALVFLFVRRASDFALFIFLQQGSILVGNLFYWTSLRRYGLRIRFAPLRATLLAIFKPAAFLLLPILLTTLLAWADRVLLGYLSVPAQVAIYDYSARLARIGITVVGLIGNVLFPRLAHLWQNGQRDVAKQVLSQQARVGATLGLLIGGGLFATATPLCSLLFGPTFGGSDTVLRIVAPMLGLVGMGLYLAGMSIDKERMVFKALAVATVVNTIANVALIPRYGAIGSAIAYVVCELVLEAIYLYILRKELRIKSLIIYITIIICISIVAYIPTHFIMLPYAWADFLAKGLVYSVLFITGAYLCIGDFRGVVKRQLALVFNRKS